MFDILISKYLDGSLTPEEDTALRSIIADNPYAKEQFNMAVSLHIAMKDEPELQIDDDVIFQTENRIFASLNIEVPQTIHTAAPGIIRSRRRRVSFSARLVMMSLVFIAMMSSVGDLRYEFMSRRFTNVRTEMNDVVDNHGVVGMVRMVSGAKKGRSREQNHAQSLTLLSSNEQSMLSPNDSVMDQGHDFPVNDTNSTKNAFVPFTVAMTSPLLNGSTFTTNTSITSFSSLSNTNKDVFNSPNQVTQTDHYQTPNTNSETTVAAKSLQQAANTSEQSHSVAIMHKSSVHLRSFLNNGYVYSKDNSVNATSFSQSIGYDVSEGTKVGLEMGQVGFTYAYQNVTPSRANDDGNSIISSRSFSKSSQKSLLGKEENDTDSDGNPNGTTSSLSMSNNDVSLYWGGAFVEQSLMNNDEVAINVSGGIGAAGSGPIFFARSYAEYKVNATISLTIGAEGKTFSIRDGRPNGKQLSSNVMIGLAYGLQIKL